MKKTVDIETLLKKDIERSFVPSNECVATTINRLHTSKKYSFILIPLSVVSVTTSFLVIATIIYFLQKLPFVYLGIVYCVYMFLGLCTALTYALGQDPDHKKGGAV